MRLISYVAYVVSAYCSTEIPLALNLDYLRIRLFWIIVDINDVLREYHLIFFEESELFFIDCLGREECVMTLFGIFCKTVSLFLQV